MTATTTIDDIAAALDEREAKPLADLQRVIDHIGAERARQLVDRAREVDAAGGMSTRDGSRRRTLGGVFFQLAREHIPRIPPPPRKRRLRWPEAAEVAAEAAAAMADSKDREESSVKITLIGRPGRTTTRGSVVVTMMYNKSRPTLPKQLPKLSGADVETPYTVFIAAKQWRKVEEALRDKDDVLIIEGYPFLDPDVTGICVFAKSTTTKLLQRARREQQRDKTGR